MIIEGGEILKYEASAKNKGTEIKLSDEDRSEIKRILPVGFAHGDRYSDAQIVGIERYCYITTLL